MQGYEFSYLPCLTLGAKGYVGVSFSLCAPVYHKMEKAFREGDHATAQRLQLVVRLLIHFLLLSQKFFSNYLTHQVSNFLTTILNYSMIPSMKFLMKEVRTLSVPSFFLCT